MMHWFIAPIRESFTGRYNAAIYCPVIEPAPTNTDTEQYFSRGSDIALIGWHGS